MAIIVDDIFELTLQGNYNAAVLLLNVFHFQVTDLVSPLDETPFTAMKLAGRDLWQQLGPVLLPVTTQDVVYTSIRGKWLTGTNINETNIYLIPSGEGVGELAQESLPPHDTWTFRYQGTGGAHRNGYKHFSGIAETGQNKGIVSSGAVAVLDDLADVLESPLTVDNTGESDALYVTVPVIVRKVAGGVDPDDIVVIDSWRPAGVVFNGIGTLNSRKYGVGA